MQLMQLVLPVELDITRKDRHLEPDSDNSGAYRKKPVKRIYSIINRCDVPYISTSLSKPNVIRTPKPYSACLQKCALQSEIPET